MTIRIIGAGMAGLLAARMLRHHDPVVIEHQNELPNNHSAVLRFRSPAIGDLLGIPFKKVRMTKATVGWRNPVADQLAYSRKTSGVSRSDRSLPLIAESHDRWVAPADLVTRMAEGLDIRLGQTHDFNDDNGKVISTIPMPTLMRLLDYDGRRMINFKSVVGFNVRCLLHDFEAYISLYVPSPTVQFNRVSVTGSEMILEYARPGMVSRHLDAAIKNKEREVMGDMVLALSMLGLEDAERQLSTLPTVTPQRYAKILPVDDEARRRFIFWASSIRGTAYQLGRFATWRPGLLMDDLIKDVRLIDSWVKTGDYGALAHESEKRS